MKALIMPVVAAGQINTVTTGRGETAARNRLAFRLRVVLRFKMYRVYTAGRARGVTNRTPRTSLCFHCKHLFVSVLFIRSALTKVKAPTDNIGAAGEIISFTIRSESCISRISICDRIEETEAHWHKR